MFSKVYTLRYEQVVPASLEAVWRFFSNPKNLGRITPSWLDFKVLSALPEEMHEGLIIHYTVRPFLGLVAPWTTEITHVRAPHYFVDEQKAGPYALWHHQHTFTEVGGGVEMVDEVNLRVGYSFLDSVIAPRVVLPMVESIFEFRRLAIGEIFPSVR